MTDEMPADMDLEDLNKLEKSEARSGGICRSCPNTAQQKQIRLISMKLCMTSYRKVEGVQR